MKKLAKIIAGYFALTAAYAMEEREALPQNNPLKQEEITIQPELPSDEVRKNLIEEVEELYQQGRKFYNGDNGTPEYQQAYDCFLKAADKGHKIAQYNVGLILKLGKGVPADLTKSLKYFELSAAQGHVQAAKYLGALYQIQNDKKRAFHFFHLIPKEEQDDEIKLMLATMYYLGQGTEKNFKEAQIVFEELAQKGKAEGQSYLGTMFLRGEGGIKDVKKGIEWLEKAVDQDHINSAFELGLIYENGAYGIQQDYEKAVFYYSKAAEKKQNWALLNYGNMLFKGRGIKQNIDKAFELYSQISPDLLATEQFLRAQVGLGLIHYCGTKKIKKNYGKAYGHFIEAVNKFQDAEASYYLARMYQKGEWVKKDLQVYIEYMGSAAIRGITLAQLDMGIANLQGIGVEKNLDHARKWFQKARKNGSLDALYNLAMTYEEEGPSQDINKAIELYKEGVAKGHVDCSFALWLIYSQGQDVDLAFFYLCKAAEKGHPDALAQIRQISEENKGK